MIRLIGKYMMYICGAALGVIVLLGILSQVGNPAQAEGGTVWSNRSYDPQFGVVCYKAYSGALSCVQVRNGTRNLSGE